MVTAIKDWSLEVSLTNGEKAEPATVDVQDRPEITETWDESDVVRNMRAGFTRCASACCLTPDVRKNLPRTLSSGPGRQSRLLSFKAHSVRGCIA